MSFCHVCIAKKDFYNAFVKLRPIKKDLSLKKCKEKRKTAALHSAAVYIKRLTIYQIFYYLILYCSFFKSHHFVIRDGVKRRV